MYQKIIPPYFPNPKLLNNLSGTTEIILGITLLIPALSTYAAWNYRPVNSHFPHSSTCTKMQSAYGSSKMGLITTHAYNCFDFMGVPIHITAKLISLINWQLSIVSKKLVFWVNTSVMNDIISIFLQFHRHTNYFGKRNHYFFGWSRMHTLSLTLITRNGITLVSICFSQ
jgi:hypothetical protein